MRILSSAMIHRCASIFCLAFAFTAAQSTQAQSFKSLHDFTGSDDGANPLNGLMIASNGLFYGTASAGGASSNGSIYTINASGDLTLLYSFKGGTDGSSPESFLIEDKSGNFYGTTSAGGGHKGGTVYELTGTKEAVLYSFGAASDGSGPQAGLTMDSSGNLYGTTAAGGRYGKGTVFELERGASGVKEIILHDFGSGTDGATPVAGVTFDTSGNLYGTTSAGGAHAYGTVFKLAKSTWTETILHSFADGDDGAVPYAGLVASSGKFYGAATEGGSESGGTVFELTPSGTSWEFSVIASVAGWGISGTFRNVMVTSSGTIYATTHCDGNDDSGTVYELTPNGSSWDYKLLYTFTGGDNGFYVFSNLVLSGGKLYGTTNQGGTSGKGEIFEVTP
jgi:uncharacterized repeat protein (TIGR03803 family)